MRHFAQAAITAGFLLAAVPAHADGGLTFVIDGDTFSSPFVITNTSTAGETVLGFGISLIPPFGFDTVNGGFGIDNSLPFTPNAAAALTTGYTGPGAFADGSTSIDFTFSDFDFGESFIWDIDVDGPNQVTVFGSDLIGSTGYADFSNGLRGNGNFVAFGAQGSQFVINAFTPTQSAVPEPGTWAMMLLGFGFVGGTMRSAKRRQRMTVSYA
ncbi:hypothetical protein A9995_03880 [Erythrobacter sp. QSSC1-22B]|uniref:PEPxxWA-CTERM sorting domain-containing protein n=1 Tax=Erythrobacter sp. QSSC1-22B TaxID=1860125 RepID=UPI00080602CC|nr:PEPxxWA-CTERM sorting domain-containing protein [Erythrobacter sp. QSSC1-22B]OBX19715.1 hypothetical protein A9995_03880 [Erythrobacter sp. QSSC1-22B]